MAIVNELRLERTWYGPSAYVLTAFLASSFNLVSFMRVEGSVSESLHADIKAVSAAFTAISLLAFAIQFVYARSIGNGQRGSWNMGFATAATVAIGIGTLATFSIDSSINFRMSTGFWMGLATFSALIPSGVLASHLVNEKWRPICLFVIASSFGRLLLLEFQNETQSISTILASVTGSNLLAFLLLVRISEVKECAESHAFKLRHQLVPVGILSGLAAVVMLGSIGRKSALNTFADEFAEVSIVGRNFFFVASIFAYATFPFLTTNQLFSRELGKRFRQAESLVVFATLVFGVLVLTNEFTARNFFSLEGGDDKFLLIVSIVSWSLLSISLVPILYYVAHNSRLGLATALPAAAMCLAQVALSTARSLAVVFLICNLFLVCIALVPTLLRSKPLLRAEIARQNIQYPIRQELVTIIVPSHNSGTAGLATVLSIHEQFESNGIDVRVIAVSDGSTDESVELFNSLSVDWFKHIRLEVNQGKGGALKEGFFESTSEITGFIDADGDIPTRLLIPMYYELIRSNADVVFGSKWHPESIVKVAKGRRLLSRFHHVFQKVLFKIDIDDTQVGIKLFKTKGLKEVLPTLQETGFSLDVEIFIALSAYGHENFVEMPVEIDRQGSSTISTRNVVMSLFELLRIFWRARICLNYEGRAYASKSELESRDA